MIFITGHHNTGKSTISRHLEQFGFVHIETGDVIRGLHKKMAPEMDFFKWAEGMGDELNDFITEKALIARKVVLESKGLLQDVIISGNRQMSGINHVIRYAQLVDGRKNLVIFFYATDEILFQRQCSRIDRKIPGLTLAKFKEEIMQYDIKMGINEIREKADIVISNDSSLQELKINIENKLVKAGYRVKNDLIKINI